MIEVEWWEFDNAATMAGEVAGDVGFIIERAIEQTGKAELAVPCGAASIPLLEALAGRDCEWSKVRLFPIEERIVAPNSPHNNHARLEAIFGGRGATVTPLLDHDQQWSTQEAGRSADARLAGLSWPVDLVWLDMGADGSTAGIFPRQMDGALNAPRERRAIGLSPDPLPAEAPVDRVTLTRNALLDAHTLIVTLSGEGAREMLERAIEDGPLSPLPIGRVLAETELPIDIYWSAE